MESIGQLVIKINQAKEKIKSIEKKYDLKNLNAKVKDIVNKYHDNNLEFEHNGVRHSAKVVEKLQPRKLDNEKVMMLLENLFQDNAEIVYQELLTEQKLITSLYVKAEVVPEDEDNEEFLND